MSKSPLGMSAGAAVVLSLLLGCDKGEAAPKPIPEIVPKPIPEIVRNPTYGNFVGQVKTEWVDKDARAMRLLENYGYLDPDGKLWIAPADSIVDGASIPQLFWSLIGGPFEGPYRNASVIHDVACERQVDQWKDVHKMFYNACLCGGVEPKKAMLMYTAVYHFGPRWEVQTEFVSIQSPAKNEPDEMVYFEAIKRVGKDVQIPAPNAEQVRALDEFIRRNNPSMQEVEQFDVSKLAKE